MLIRNAAHPMSSLTKDLREFENDYYEKASQETGVSGFLKTKAIAPLVTFGVSLILHAEAVCRAVIICFLSIKNSFSQTNEELLEKQRKECSIAYSESIAAFFSIFSKTISTLPKPAKQLVELVAEKAPKPVAEAPPARLREAVPEEPVLAAVLLGPVHDLDPAPVERRPDAPAEDEFVDVQQDRDEPPHAVDRLSEEGELVEEQHEVQSHSSGVLVESPRPPSRRSNNPSQGFEAIDELPAAPAPLDVTELEGNGQMPQAPKTTPAAGPLSETSEPVYVEDDASSFTDGSLVDLDPMTKAVVFDSGVYSEVPVGAVRDPFAGFLPRDPAEKREQAFMRATRVLNEQEATERLNEAIIRANVDISKAPTQQKYIPGDDAQIGNMYWDVSRPAQRGWSVGLCQYIGPNKQFTIVDKLTFKDAELFAPLFGIFDPQNGLHAAQYLSAKLRPTLETYLCSSDIDKLSTGVIYNRLSQAIQQLNTQFIAEQRPLTDHGASMGVILILGGFIWCVQLGNVTVMVDDGEKPVQMTRKCNPKLPEFRTMVEELGGTVDAQGRVDGKLNMATVFGRRDIVGVSRQPLITRYPLSKLKAGAQIAIANEAVLKEDLSSKVLFDWMAQNRKTEVHELAHGIVNSTQKLSHSSCLVIRPQYDLNLIE